MKALNSIPKAIGTSGFQKAMLYSFGSWLVAWIITWLALPEAMIYLGKYGVIIPLINTILVAIKQWLDEMKK